MSDPSQDQRDLVSSNFPLNVLSDFKVQWCSGCGDGGALVPCSSCMRAVCVPKCVRVPELDPRQLYHAVVERGAKFTCPSCHLKCSSPRYKVSPHDLWGSQNI